MNTSSVMSDRKLRITLLADEWKSSKGGLSTMNRELAIQLAKHSNVDVTFFVPKCTADDKKAANSHGISIVEAKRRPGFEPNEWLCFPSSDLVIDIIIGHGVKLGKQAQVIRDSHHCTWVQVVHTAPEELAMFKTYSGAISKGDEKQWTEVNLCKIADLVVAVGPKLHEFYSAYLISCDKNVFNLTPGIFTELSTLQLKLSTEGAKKFRVLVFGRGDSEDFELKGFDIAAKAVAELNDKSYHLIFVGASGNEKQVADRLLKQGLKRKQLTVKGYLENRDDLATLLSTANLAIIPSRTEGFGLTALEALSAGLPFLVSQNSGFGEALQEITWGSSWIVDSEDPEHWAEAIKSVREKGRETALEECQKLRTSYAEKYSWEKQCNHLVQTLAHSKYNYTIIQQVQIIVSNTIFEGFLSVVDLREWPKAINFALFYINFRTTPPEISHVKNLVLRFLSMITRSEKENNLVKDYRSNSVFLGSGGILSFSLPLIYMHYYLTNCHDAQIWSGRPFHQ